VNELGNLREDFGELKGTVNGIKQTVTRLETKIDEGQRDSLAAHLRLDTAIAKLSARIDTHDGINGHKNNIWVHVWRATYTLVAAILGSVGTWWLSSGSGGAHP